MKGEIIERGDKVFQLRIYLGRDENRKKQYHIETFKGGRRAAENRLSELVTKFNKGELASQSALTLADYFTIWKRDALDGSVTKRTANHYEFLIKKHLTPALGKTRLAKLTPLEVQRYYSALREKGYSGKTIRHIHGVLSKALSQAVNWGILNANPAKQVALPKRVKKEMKSFTSDQAIAFLEAAKEDRYAAMWFLAIDSGMRPEEYLALRWSDIKNGIVTIQRVLCLYSGSGGFYFDEPKTPQSRRSIPLSQATLAMLAQHKNKQNIERLKAGPKWQDEGLIFTSKTGGPISLQNLRKRNFLPILKRAGIPLEYRIYDLRHTMATLLLEANENPKVVSERLGHASITLTLDNYSHVLPTMQERAKTALENQVFSKVAGFNKE